MVLRSQLHHPLRGPRIFAFGSAAESIETNCALVFGRRFLELCVVHLPYSS